MNERQQVKREEKQWARALLTKSITKEEYKQLLQGKLCIVQGELMRVDEDGYVTPIRKLENDYQRKRRILDSQIDQLLGLGPKHPWEELDYVNMQAIPPYTFTYSTSTDSI